MDVTGKERTRLLPLAGGFNLRDFGGYETTDGLLVHWGRLYRSGVMARLTSEDAVHLGGLGITTICDFRREDEREKQPTLWHQGSQTEYLAWDHGSGTGIMAELTGGVTSAAQMRDVMIRSYGVMLKDHARGYAMMLQRLAEGRAPLLINCSAGKDRTGIGAALILSALGVSRNVIVEDYLLTNSLADFDKLFPGISRGEGSMAPYAHMMGPLLAADPEYLESMFSTLDKEHGGIDGYISGTLGLGSETRTNMRKHLLAS